MKSQSGQSRILRIARMNILTKIVDPNVAEAPRHILEKHFQRKHGPNAYYGQ